MDNVIVIGGGPAGLTAAYELLKNGKGKYNVTVLEESQALGGISKTVCHNGLTLRSGKHIGPEADDTA